MTLLKGCSALGRCHESPRRGAELWSPPCVQVHEATIAAGAYPSPLNYYSFPKSLCTSVNEVGGACRDL